MTIFDFKFKLYMSFSCSYFRPRHFLFSYDEVLGQNSNLPTMSNVTQSVIYFWTTFKILIKIVFLQIKNWPLKTAENQTRLNLKFVIFCTLALPYWLLVEYLESTGCQRFGSPRVPGHWHPPARTSSTHEP